MARSINKVILVGYLGIDPELRYTPAGTPVCKLRLATSERFTDAEGNLLERTEWHSLVVWNRLAEVANQYLRKGGTDPQRDWPAPRCARRQTNTG